jgi:ABC-type branched-subunit amino acid transport system substrate-binding protein
MRPRRIYAALVSRLVVAAFVGAVFVGSVSVGCGGIGSGAPVASVPERRAYQAARSQISSNPNGAEAAFLVFLENWPDGALAPKAAARLGTLARQRGETELALERYTDVLERYPGAEDNDIVRLRIAEIELDRGNPQAAAEVLGRARMSRLSEENRRTAYRVLADAANDPVTRLRSLARLRVVEPDDATVAEIDAKIDAVIAALDADDLDRATDQIGREIPAARLALRRADLALTAGDLDGAESALESATRVPRTPATERAIERMRRRIAMGEAGPVVGMSVPTFEEAQRAGMPSTAGARGTLGVVLPLSGSFAGFGRNSLEGILLAAGVFGAEGPAGGPPNVRLVVRDTGGSAARAATAVRELAADPSVTAIIGPLLKDECEAAAAAAEDAGIPLIALSSHVELAQQRSQVFRVRTRPEEETKELVDRAVNEFEAQRFAIFYPRDAYGRGLRGLFWDAVEDRGGHVVAVASYDPKATDFGESIRPLVGWTLLNSAESKAIAAREEMREQARRLPPEEGLLLREEASALTTEEGEPLPPIVDFDALFIPETHENVVLIAPQLAFHEVVGARLLGASGWNDPDLVTIGRDHVADAIFTAQYFADSPLEPVRDFHTRFETSCGESPNDFAAQAYDAANLAIVQLAKGRASREDLRVGLLEMRGYPGVTGVLSMGADGNAHKRPILLGVVDGRIRQIN